MVKAGEKKSFLKMNDCTTLDILNNYIDGNGTGTSSIEEWRDRDDYPGGENHPNAGSLIDDAVAYSWGGCDTVAQFNSKIELTTDWLQGTGVPMPVGDWDFYRQAVEGFDVGYMPRGHGSLNWTWSAPRYYAGIDCSKFVQRGARYHTTTGQVTKEDANTYTISLGLQSTDQVHRGMTEAQFNTFQLQHYLGCSHIRTDTFSDAITNDNLLVPGDVLIEPGNGHIVVIWKIDTSTHKRGTWHQHQDVITVIEAYGTRDRVYNQRTYNQINNYIRRRLKE